MMGLLDLLQSDDPAVKQGFLQFGLGLLSSKGNFGNALGNAGQQGLAGALGYRDRQAQQKRAGMQDQLTQGQIQQMQRQQELQALPGQFMQPAMKPDSMDNRDVGMQGEQPVNPASFNTEGYLTALQGKDPFQAMQMRSALTPKAPELQSFAPGHTVGTNVGGKFTPQFTVPQEAKPESIDPFIRMLTQSGIDPKSPQGQQLIRSKLQKDTTHAPATSVTTNMGQKGYENESKLRNDFKSEPIYKDYQDMSSAHKQIKAGIAAGTPIGDVATATKIMKLLDPGSVVRESELGIAMAAGGRMDRLQNMAQMWMKGDKLTPQQRKDFGALSDELMAAAGQAYNNKRGEYEKTGSRYGLDPTVLGSPYSGSSVVDFGKLK